MSKLTETSRLQLDPAFVVRDAQPAEISFGLRSTVAPGGLAPAIVDHSSEIAPAGTAPEITAAATRR